ncbi:MAG: hypothetical protein JXR53_00060 [Bacteroidales bacterium]|nr:hypothetical protein [Bacteroidales bacterium]
MKISIALIVISLLSACGNIKNDNNESNLSDSGEKITFSKIVYSYTDSSVPPEFHRSYDIVMTETEAYVKVNSYGQLLTDTIVPIKEGAFQLLIDSFPSYGIEECEDAQLIDCDGGTSAFLALYDKNEKEILNGNIYYCGAATGGNICGDVNGFAILITSIISDFGLLLKEDNFDEEK